MRTVVRVAFYAGTFITVAYALILLDLLLNG